MSTISTLAVFTVAFGVVATPLAGSQAKPNSELYHRQAVSRAVHRIRRRQEGAAPWKGLPGKRGDSCFDLTYLPKQFACM
jgi:hypothetical protein